MLRELERYRRGFVVNSAAGLFFVKSRQCDNGEEAIYLHDDDGWVIMHYVSRLVLWHTRGLGDLLLEIVKTMIARLTYPRRVLCAEAGWTHVEFDLHFYQPIWRGLPDRDNWLDYGWLTRERKK